MNGILVFDQNQVVEEVEGVVKLAGGAASHSRQKIRGWKIQSLSSPPLPSAGRHFLCISTNLRSRRSCILLGNGRGTEDLLFALFHFVCWPTINFETS